MASYVANNTDSPVDRRLVYDPRYLYYAGVVSFVSSLIIFRIVGPILSSRCTISYPALTSKNQAEWNERIVSTVHSMFAITMSVGSLLLDVGMADDVIWYNGVVARIACAIVSGYMFADAVIMIVWCKYSLGEFLGFIFHHIATVSAYYFVSTYGVLCYFAMLRLTAELSVPCMNQRWFFDKCGYPRSNKIVIMNAMLMVLGFFLSRMVLMPVFWSKIYLSYGNTAGLGYIRFVLYVPGAVLDTLNVYWFYKMCKGLYKAIRTLLNAKKEKES